MLDKLLVIKSLQTRKIHFLILPVSLLMAYIFSIFVNTARIIFSLTLDKIFAQSWAWFHEAEGAFIYLFFLICIYFVAEYSLKLANDDEKYA